MMKKLFVVMMILGSLGWTSANAQRAREGAAAPELKGITLLNAPVDDITLEELKGKVVIVEFWATWCGPCVQVAKHLDNLQQELGDKLQVISLSYEDQARIERYVREKPTSAWVGVYDGALESSYPHNAIPHGILIGPDGVIAEIDHPAGFSASQILALYNSGGTGGSSTASTPDRDPSDPNNLKLRMGRGE